MFDGLKFLRHSIVVQSVTCNSQHKVAFMSLLNTLFPITLDRSKIKRLNEYRFIYNIDGQVYKCNKKRLLYMY